MAAPKPNLVDQRQRDLAACDLSRAYCVEAAAGTGKTTLLVERLLSIVRRGEAELSQIAAITFTEKAAAELRVRLREKLEESRRQAAPGERERFAQALEQLDRATISTIHAFAGSLLRERPVEARIDPGFEQLDEMGSQLLIDDVWQAWKERQLAHPLPILRRLFSLEISLDTVKGIAERLLDNRDLLELPLPAPPPPPVNEIWSDLAASVDQLRQLEVFCDDPEDRGFQLIQRLKEFVDHGPTDELDRERALLLDLKVELKAGAQKNWRTPAHCNQQKEIARELRGLADSAADRLGPSLAAGVLAWLKEFLNDVEREKHARGVLDFQDLLLKSRALVRDHLEVRAYFQQKIRYLLVDEFQDTDPLQAELVFFLAEENASAGAAARDWREVRLASDKLFLVGDPKQSIYRFRRADIQVYEQAKRMVGGQAGSEPLVIRQNFRSSGWLLQAINALFAPQMAADDYQAAYVPLEPAPGRPNAGPGVALLFPPDGYEPSGMELYREVEANLIAAFLRQVHDSAESPVRIWDTRKQEIRRARFGDMALLFPVTAGLEHYEQALRAHGVPFQLEAGRQFYERREIRDLISVLSAIDNPEDAIALVAALRSPFFGLSDEDLFLYHHAGGQLHYLRPEVEGFPPMASSLRQLRRWHERRVLASLSALLDTVLDESCILPFLLLLPDGEPAVGNLLRMVELARRFESHAGACLRAFVRWLEQRASSELAESEAGLADEQIDAVRLLTIHAAKGLEFPVVALTGMACNPRRGQDLLFDHARGEIGLSFKCGKSHLTSANFSQLAQADQLRSRAEDLRLFYVAATRAKDCLIIPRVAPASGGSRFGGFYDAQLKTYGGKPAMTLVENGVFRCRAEDLPAPAAAPPVLRHDIGSHAPAPETIAPVLAERAAWKARLSAAGVNPEPVAAPRQPEPSDEQRRAEAYARALGSAFHQVMQEMRWPEEPLLEAIAASAAAAAGVAEDIGMLKDWVTRALASPVLLRARQAPHIWRETPFCIEQDGQLVEGRIDLLFAEADGLVLVDYKTDEVDAAGASAAAEAHRPQLDLYRHAVRQLTGHEPREVLVHFVRVGVAVTVYSRPLRNEG